MTFLPRQSSLTVFSIVSTAAWCWCCDESMCWSRLWESTKNYLIADENRQTTFRSFVIELVGDYKWTCIHQCEPYNIPMVSTFWVTFTLRLANTIEWILPIVPDVATSVRCTELCALPVLVRPHRNLVAVKTNEMIQLAQNSTINWKTVVDGAMLL